MDTDKSLNLAALVMDLASAYVLAHRVWLRVRLMRSKPEAPVTNLRLVS